MWRTILLKSPNLNIVSSLQLKATRLGLDLNFLWTKFWFTKCLGGWTRIYCQWRKSEFRKWTSKCKTTEEKNNFGKLDESNRRTNEGENIDINDHPSIFWSILQIKIFDRWWWNVIWLWKVYLWLQKRSINLIVTNYVFSWQ